jgi:heterotetrameric sarcosine oxidase delta subunit
MLTITCPWCGPRDEPEFLNGGEAHLDRPDASGPVGDQAWADYLFFHDNPRGPLRERWVHAYGCRRWFNAVRDTATHRLIATYRLDEPAPETEA